MYELDYLKKQLNELIQLREDKLNSGNVQDFTQYKAVVGERTGLLLAVRECEDLQQKRKNADGDID
jgi:hypothetical protein